MNQTAVLHFERVSGLVKSEVDFDEGLLKLVPAPVVRALYRNWVLGGCADAEGTDPGAGHWNMVAYVPQEPPQEPKKPLKAAYAVGQMVVLYDGRCGRITKLSPPGKSGMTIAFDDKNEAVEVVFKTNVIRAATSEEKRYSRFPTKRVEPRRRGGYDSDSYPGSFGEHPADNE